MLSLNPGFFPRQAYATRDDFAQQRTAITNINSRVGGIISESQLLQIRLICVLNEVSTCLTGTFPGINSLLGMINSRRRRDTAILGTVVGICTIILLWWIGLL